MTSQFEYRRVPIKAGPSKSHDPVKDHVTLCNACVLIFQTLSCRSAKNIIMQSRFPAAGGDKFPFGSLKICCGVPVLREFLNLSDA